MGLNLGSEKGRSGVPFIAFLFLFILPSPSFSAEKSTLNLPPKLIVTLVIDQFRSDYLSRFESEFLPPIGKNGEIGGFRYLMTRGAYFPYGEYQILQNMTCPGHATILTGSYPYRAGIPLNVWFDVNQGRPVYCTEDLKSPLVGLEPPQLSNGTSAPNSIEDSPEIHQQEAHGISISGRGRSPRNLIATTVGDELKNSGYPSRVISISLKDRSAILLGGHEADLALWYHQKSNRWISSQYYLPDGKLPVWTVKLNEDLQKNAGKPYVWTPGKKSSGFTDSSAFPHRVRYGTPEALGTPLGVDMTVEAAKRALDTYQLGSHAVPDLLAVSFSSHDIVGHAYGPNSREAEEITLAEDRALSQLFNFIRKKIPGGLSRVVIVLTGDHGVAPVPEWASARRLSSGRLNENDLASSLSAHLNQTFGKPATGAWIAYAADLNFTVNREALKDRNETLEAVEAEAKRFVLQMPEVAFAFTSTDVANRKLPPEFLERQILRTYIPGKSGDLVLILKPYYTLAPPKDLATHLSGYNYDRTVPILIYGAQIKAGTYATPAHVVDIAPTLTYLTRTLPPSLSEGVVLSEILKRQETQ